MKNQMSRRDFLLAGRDAAAAVFAGALAKSGVDAQGTDGAALIPPTPTPTYDFEALMTQQAQATPAPTMTPVGSPTMTAPEQQLQALPKAMDVLPADVKEWFTVNPELRMSHLAPNALEIKPEHLYFFSDAQNMDKSGGTTMPDGTFVPAIARYRDGWNDYTSTGEGFKAEPQINGYTIQVYTGEAVGFEEMGMVTGEPGTAVAVIILNPTENDHAWDENQFYVKHGFRGDWTSWDLSDGNIPMSALAMGSHYGNILLNGTDLFRAGQCDGGEDHCGKVRIVTLLMRDFDSEGNPIFTLLSADEISQSEVSEG